ncbi:mechanosensitive ion channel family protein [Bacteroides sp. 519]|uniref:mechanosensitive ion channel family protein n=1 Tax=Bacteroides sp. 519 TaxID=2302937 RepID=UPI0013D3B145|nr:mechanosensitive ion channel family protein [Bacteroides sp. 519]NDV59824.1 mechanosensitive ion channel family protein [Bacteroides sp. 519]
MLEKEVWGNTIENWGISILIVLGAIVVTRLISLFNKKVIKPYTQKTKNKLDDVTYEAIESPLLFGIMLIGIWIALHRLAYPDNFVKAVDSAYRILIVLNVTWFLARLVNSLLEVYWTDNADGTNRAQRFSSKMMPVVRRTLLVIVWIVGIVMALSNVGVNISALLGTLGIGGIAFALAAQDTIKNVFGAFTILTDRPFNIGDTIKIDSYEGTIVDVGIRSTKMRNYDKRLITFPNYKIADASIVNITAEPMRRVVMNIGLTYDTKPDAMSNAMEILRDIPTKIQYVSPKNIVANFTDFTDSALVITFIYFIEKKGDIGKVKSNVNMEILRSFNDAGLNFAFPSQTLYIEGAKA